MNRLVFIVSRGRPDLYNYLLTHFAGEKDVEVILDRRQGEQNGKDRLHDPERRQSKARPLLDNSDDVTVVEPPSSTPSAANPGKSKSPRVEA